MIMKHARLTLVTVLALGGGIGSSTAFAQSGYPGSYYPGSPYVGRHGVPYDRVGHFSCGYNELHTRLERKNCGGTHYRS